MKINRGLGSKNCCGGTTQKVIHHAINKQFNKDDKIDVLFISHFHRDHVNGLQHLLKRCDVKKVVIPHLSAAMRALYVTQNHCLGKNSKFLDNLVLNPTVVIGDDRLCRVMAPGEQEELIEIELEYLSDQIASGSLIKADSHDWVYVPFNLNNHTFANSLWQKLSVMGIGLDNLIEKLKDTKTKKQIVSLYTSVVEKTHLNANSLCVYSGPRPSTVMRAFGMATKQGDLFSVQDKVGCLYTADYEAKQVANFSLLETSFKPYWSEISTVQIPHHGSSHNYNPVLARQGGVSIISAGRSNRYGHPHADVLKEIAQAQSTYYWVNEDTQTLTEQYIRQNKIVAMACIGKEVADKLVKERPECFI